ncbi:MAG: YbaK/EbsC family protein [Gammaproteobacteria bacterium]|jgi:Ala-tRNA(Pro) deacylase|nr:YbaK/EbsC family protein [Gammaproteobacteria bacterium]
MPSKKLKAFLDSHTVKYVSISHSLAFTGLEIAKSAHVPTKTLAKTVILKINGEPAMMVLPAAFQIDMKNLSQALQGATIELATEQEFFKWFPDCEVGAMPPFGNLYAMKVYVAERLTENEDIVFNAGSHSEVIQMAYGDYENLVRPTMVVLDE